MPPENTPGQPQDKTQLAGGEQSITGEFAPGDIVDGTYEILDFIGAGGMGNVYRVRHTIMDKEYALKTLSYEKVTEVAWRRFQNEAQAIARMNHPNVVGIYNLGRHDNHLPYYVMDLFTGKPLVDILQKTKRLETKKALAIFVEVCAGVGYAHKKGVVHRDIKPGNIVVLDHADGLGASVKIVDFGIAKLSHTKDMANQQLTHVGEIFGSPFYMSPEQCEGGKVDARSDIYSLGCTLFETLTGSPPFKGQSAVETMLLHGTMPPPTLQEGLAKCGPAKTPDSNFPPALENIVAKTLAKEPMDRYQNVDQLGNELAQLLHQGEKSQTQSPSGHFAKVNQITTFIIASIVIAAAGTLIYLNVSPREVKQVKDIGPDAILSGFGNDTTSNGTSIKNAVENMPAFSKIISGKDGKETVHFSFPKGKFFGLLEEPGKEKLWRCENCQINLPSGQIRFIPSNPFAEHPEYFKLFDPQSINYLSIDRNQFTISYDGSILNNISSLKSLKGLLLKDCEKIKEKAVAQIDLLTQLEELEIRDCGFNATDLARSKQVKILTSLKIDPAEEVTPLLKILKNSKHIKILQIPNARMTEENYRLIATMINLEELDCSDSGITNEDLNYLAGLKHIRKLNAMNNTFTADAIKPLKKIFVNPHSFIDIRSKTIRPADFLSIQAALPDVEFAIHDNRRDD